MTKLKAQTIYRCDRCGSLSPSAYGWATLELSTRESTEKLDLCASCFRNIEAFIFRKDGTK